MKEWQIKELQARRALENEFRMRFSKGYPVVGEFTREIDIMSEDESVAAQVKAGRDFEPNGRIKAYRFAEICTDCLILLSIPAKRKIMFIGDQDMHEQFKRESKGFPFHDIEVRLI